jgi:hypothetical protein
MADGEHAFDLAADDSSAFAVGGRVNLSRLGGFASNLQSWF